MNPLQILLQTIKIFQSAFLERQHIFGNVICATRGFLDRRFSKGVLGWCTSFFGRTYGSMVVSSKRGFYFRKQKQVCWGQVGTISKLVDNGDGVIDEIFCYIETTVCKAGCIALMHLQLLAMAGLTRLTIFFSRFCTLVIWSLIMRTLDRRSEFSKFTHTLLVVLEVQHRVCPPRPFANS